MSEPASGIGFLTPHLADCGTGARPEGTRSAVLWGDCVSFQVLRLVLCQPSRDLVATASTY